MADLEVDGHRGFAGQAGITGLGGRHRQRIRYAPRHAAGGGAFTGPLWRQGDFLKLWGGQTVSMLGSRVTELALPLTAMLLLSASPAELGYLNVAEYLPVTLVTLFAGVLADRYRRRPILITANIGRALILGLVPLLAFTHLLSMPVLYLVAFLTGILTSQFDVAYQAYVPVLVEKKNLVEANSKLQSTRSIAETGGQGFSGVLIQLLTAPGAIIVDCLSYLVSAAALIGIRSSEPSDANRAARRNMWVEIGEGLRVTLGNRLLRAVLMQSAWFNLLADVVLVVFPLYAIRSLHLTPGALGIIIAAGSVGAFAGSTVAQPLARRAGIGPAMVAGMGLASGSMLLLPLAAGPRPAMLVVLAAGYVLNGIGIAIFNIHSVALRQTVVPDRLIGRVSATYRFVAWAVIPIGGLIGGALAERLGPRAALLTTAIGLAVGAGVFGLSKAGRTREPPPADSLLVPGSPVPGQAGPGGAAAVAPPAQVGAAGVLPAHVGAPGEAVPAPVGAAAVVPGQAVPGQAVPGQAVPGQVVPGQVVPSPVVPALVTASPAVPGQVVPGAVVPGEAELEEAAAVAPVSPWFEHVDPTARFNRFAQAPPASAFEDTVELARIVD